MNLNLEAGETVQELATHPGRARVGYIDCCAAEPGMHSGSPIFDVIARMPFMCVACHSILLQGTVDFWMSRGMRRFDPANPKDCKEFRRNILARSMGKAFLDLNELAQS